MHHEVLVITLGVILAELRAPAFGTLQRGLHGGLAQKDQVAQLDCGHQVGIEGIALVVDRELGVIGLGLHHAFPRFLQLLLGPEYAAILIHNRVQRVADVRLLGCPGAGSRLQRRHRLLHVGHVVRVALGPALARAILHKIHHRLAGDFTEHDGFQKRISPQSVGPMHAHAGGFACREQAVQCNALAALVGADATHGVVAGRAHRNRLVNRVDPFKVNAQLTNLR